VSIHDNSRLEKKDKARSKKLSKTPWAAPSAKGKEVNWEAVDGFLLASMIDAVCRAGASVQLTRTKDGGSLGVRVYDDGMEIKTEWERPDEGLEALLEAIRDYYLQQLEQGD